MDRITLKLPKGRKDDLRVVQFWGQRRLQGFADTGVFTISDKEPQTITKPQVAEREIDDTLAPMWIDLEKPLEIAGGDSGGDDPYNRDNYSRHAISR